MPKPIDVTAATELLQAAIDGEKPSDRPQKNGTAKRAVFGAGGITGAAAIAYAVYSLASTLSQQAIVDHDQDNQIDKCREQTSRIERSIGGIEAGQQTMLSEFRALSLTVTEIKTEIKVRNESHR